MASSVKYLSYDGLKKFTSSIGQLFAAEIKGTTATDSISIYPVAKYKEYTNGSLSASYSEKALPGVEIPLAGASTATNAGLVAASEYAKLKNLDVNHWHTINTITPGSPKSTLTITGGTNVTVTTTASTNKISFSSPNVAVSSDGDGNAVTLIEQDGHGIKYTLGSTFSLTGHTHPDYVNQNAFSKIAVSGQSNVQADAAGDTVTFVAGDYMTITTDATNDKVTFKSAGVSVSSDGDGNVITSIASNGHGIKFTKGKSVYSTSEVYTKGEVDALMVSALEYKGAISTATTSPGAFTPAATKGNVYVVTGSGYINGVAVEEGDMFLCKADSVAAATSSNYSTIQASWNVVNVNWNVVDNKKVLPQNGTTYEIAKVGGHSIHVGVEANTTSGSLTASQQPSHGNTFNIISGGSFDGKELKFTTNTVKLPSESTLSVNSTTGTGISGSHGGSFNVVTGITGSGHTITYTLTAVTLPSETTLSKGTTVTAAVSPAHGATFTAITDFSVSGHQITPTVTTYTLPSVPDVAVIAGTTATSSPGHSGTFNVISSIESNGHGIKINTTKITLPSDNNTKNTAGASNSNSKLYLVGATAQSASPQTYTHDTAFVDANGILNSGSTTTCASTITHAGTMVITCNDAITTDDIDALFV